MLNPYEGILVVKRKLLVFDPNDGILVAQEAITDYEYSLKSP